MYFLIRYRIYLAIRRGFCPSRMSPIEIYIYRNIYI